MRKKILSLAMALCMMLQFVPLQARAAGSTMDDLDMNEISKTEYAISPDVKEYEWLLNNSQLSTQMVGHVMEVNLGEGSTASLATGYSDYNIDNIANGQWAMATTTAQAQAMESRRGVNVVGAVNGGGYDMSNGRPTGALVLDGTVIQDANNTTFWIDADGQAHITSAADYRAEVAKNNVKEALSSFGDIVRNGEAISGLDNSIRASRTAVGIKADGTVVLLMVDGRQAPYSVGMTMAELAAAMVELDCEIAINLDGGGSATFATQREGDDVSEVDPYGESAGLTLRCRPSDGFERKVSNTLMVISDAKPTGEFDHAVLTPNNEIYTPGSTVEFEAAGVDSGGYTVAVPEGAVWSVTSGASLGTIDEATGVFTAEAGAEGMVGVSLSYGGVVVGSTRIELRWPDELGFTNSSVSLDFGQSSDLTFKPTYQGREVNYKDGDFVWSLDEEELTYKYLAPVEQYYTPWWQAAAYRWVQLNLPLTGKTDEDGTVTLKYAYESILLYESRYKSDREIGVLADGTLQVTETLTHQGATLYSYLDGTTVLMDNITEDFGNTTLSDGKAYGIKGLSAEKTVRFSLGSFSDNRFTADEETSMRGTINVSLAADDSVTGSVDVVVGMEPYVLMDFEDQVVGGTVVSAEEYWTCHVGKSLENGGNSLLTAAEVAADRLWIRDTTGRGVKYPAAYNAVVSADEDSNVRFGRYAFRIGYDFTDISESSVASADFGFSGDMLVNTVQPTKIGVWINVPSICENDDSVLKAVLKGGATVNSAAATSYMTLNEDGTTTYASGELTGTASYVQYYSYNADGTVSGSTLSDWAGKGWIWVEADISAFQMPLDVCRAYTIRVTSPQNCTKSSGYIYIDNLQFIYGTNTNDINNPVVETVTETGSGTVLTAGEVTELTSGTLNFSVTFSDNELSDKYATGIDSASTRVYVDGVDYSSEDCVELGADYLYLTGLTLRNGTHTLTVYLKDNYGNDVTTEYTIRVSDPEGSEAGIALAPQENPPVIGQPFAFYIVNVTNEDIFDAVLEIEIPEKYLENVSVEGLSPYEASYEIVNGRLYVYISNNSFSATSLDPQEIVEYDHEMACLLINVPADSAENDTFQYTLKSGSYTTADEEYTLSGTKQTIALSAEYQLMIGYAIVGEGTEIKVVDDSGSGIANAEIYSGETLLGKTGAKGTLTYTFTGTGLNTLYAKKGENLSWHTNIVVCAKPTVNGGAPFGVLTNAVENASTNQSITWFTSIDSSDAKAVVRYSTSSDMSGASEAVGSSELRCFVEATQGSALRGSTVVLAGLTPGTTYYYQVGDGSKWSDTYTFSTTAASAEKTSFFVLGDIQTSDTSRLTAALKRLADGEYDFGIQTGDAIDSVTSFSEWQTFFTVFNAETVNGVDIIHVLGNHEYYGDIDGEISGAVYDLPESGQNGWYVMEYGNVCVVAVNHGTALLDAVTEIADRLETDCAWKVLVTHEPIYGTTDQLSEEKLLAITAQLEKAGFDFVFSGDDHSYARTYPMLGNEAQAESSRDGIVYYISGDLSGKTNAFTKQDAHVLAIGHTDYQGLYLTAEATNEQITINAYTYNGELIDSYTEKRTDCELGRHTTSTNSIYCMEDDTVTCVLCGEKAAADTSGCSGLLSTDDGKQVILANGDLKKGEFTQLGDTMYHSCDDGYAHIATMSTTRTCVKGGRNIFTCGVCGKTTSSAFIYPAGHDWDEDHICNTCGFEGIDISDADVTFYFGTESSPKAEDYGPNYYYKSTGVRPSSFAKMGDYVLTMTNDANLTDASEIADLYRYWPDSKSVGKARIVFEGRGDYYGEKVLYYYIIPNKLTDVTVSNVTNDGATLSWTAAPGAGEYVIYKCNAGNTSRAKIGTTSACSYELTGLAEDTQYYYTVYSRTYAEDEDRYYYSGASPVASVKTLLSADVTGVSAVVDGVEIPAVTVDGSNYLFLPASADLTKLSLSVTRAQEQGPDATVTGDLGSAVAGTVDLTKIASEKDGARTITVSIGGGTSMTVKVMQGSGIPTVYLTSSDTSEGRAWVEAVKGNQTTGTMLMVADDGSVIYNDALKQIKARGNSTFTYAEKKSYQIKLGTKADLLDNGESVKTWVLLANYFDATLMHDKLLKDIAGELEMPYVADSTWVNLYYDGEYRGVYLLSEKNSLSSTSVDITDLEAAYEELNEGYGDDMQTATATNKYGQEFEYTTGLIDPDDLSGGYLLELNKTAWDEVNGFATRKGMGVNVKSPEWSGKSAVKYISEFYQEFEDAVYATDTDGNYTGYNATTGKYFYEYVDMTSLVQVFLIQELGLNPDGFISSLYFYKDADSDVMYAGPIWDQDMTFGTGWSKHLDADVNYSYHYLAEALIKIPAFCDAVKTYYTNTLAPLVENTVLGDNGMVRAQEELLSDNAAMNYVLWPYVRVGNPEKADHLWTNASYSAVIDDMYTWITTRMELLDRLFKLEWSIGDVNMDGEINSDDAVAILRWRAGYEDEGVDPGLGDFNGDGVVDSDDAVAILRWRAGYED